MNIAAFSSFIHPKLALRYSVSSCYNQWYVSLHIDHILLYPTNSDVPRRQGSLRRFIFFISGDSGQSHSSPASWLHVFWSSPSLHSFPWLFLPMVGEDQAHDVLRLDWYDISLLPMDSDLPVASILEARSYGWYHRRYYACSPGNLFFFILHWLTGTLTNMFVLWNNFCLWAGYVVCKVSWASANIRSMWVHCDTDPFYEFINVILSYSHFCI